jgi:hypothetical protein
MKTQTLMMSALAALLFADGAFAACNYRQETNDFFSGVPTTRTAWTNVNPGNCEGDCNARGAMSIVSESGTQWVEFDAWFTNSHVFAPTQVQLDNAFVIQPGTILEIALADGSLVELPIIEPVVATTLITYPYANNNDNYLVRASARMHFELSEAALNALAAQKSSTIRLVQDDMQLTMPVPKKRQTPMDAAICLQKAGSK